MQDILFDTEEKRQEAIIAFTELVAHPGWSLFVKVKEANMQALREELEDYGVEHTAARDEVLRAELNIHRRDISLPNDKIREFREGPSEGVNPIEENDPFERPVLKIKRGK